MHSEGLYKLEKWSNRNFMKFSKGKFKVLPLSRNNCRHQVESGFAEMDFKVLVNELNMRQQCILMSSNFLDCTRKSFATRPCK